MPTITIPAVRLDITLLAADGDLARTVTRQDATITIASEIDEPSFFYDFDPSQSPDEALEILITPNGFTLADIDAGGAFTGDQLDAELSLVQTDNGDFTLFNLFRESDDLTQVTNFFVRLAGDELPEISNAAEFNAFFESINMFDVAPLPFSPGGQIPLLSFPSASLQPDAPVLTGTSGPDVIEGDTGADVIDGLGGADTISGRRGDDSLSGGGGRDVVLGQGGFDTINGDGGADNLRGGGGADELFGGRGRDTLLGNGGRDALEGDGGRDQLIGGSGSDTLDGGRGADQLTGGGGRDFFAFSTGGGRDRVLDYRDGQDRFMIENGAGDFAGLAIIDLGDDALIRFSNVRIIVEDTDHLILDASDFLFG